jgi:hypothetical protein
MRLTGLADHRASRSSSVTATEDLEELPGSSLPASPRNNAPQRRSRWHPVVVLTSLVGFTGLAVLYTFTSAHTVGFDSDNATVVLQGHAMELGNLLLHGWALSLDNFWSVDVPLYAIGDIFTGVRPALLSVVPAVIATLVVLVAILIATTGRGRSASVVGGLTVLGLLAFPSYALASTLLQGPMHIGTALWALVAFYALRRGRMGWGVAVAALFLAAGMLGDLLMVAYGTAPVLLAGLVAMVRRRSWSAGTAPVAAAIGGSALAVVGHVAIGALGAFSINPSHPAVPPGELLGNVGRALHLTGELLGTGTAVFPSGGVSSLLQATHVVGTVVVAACFVLGVGRLVVNLFVGHTVRARHGADNLPGVGAKGHETGADPQILDDLLVFACVGSVVTFCEFALTPTAPYARYLVPTVIFAVALSGRTVARLWDSGFHTVGSPGSRTARRSISVLRWVAVALGIVGGLGAVSGLGVILAEPVSAAPQTQLVSFLEAHHLTEGIGDYWSASITTVESSSHVRVRPVVAKRNSHIVRYLHQSSASWYTGHRFGFLVYNAASPWGGVDVATATVTFGAPTHVDVVGSYRVLIWNQPVTVNAHPKGPQ